MIKSATSPAGDEIEILSDTDWVALTGVPAKSLSMWQQGGKRFVLGDLWRNGPVEDFKSGRATGLLWDRLKETYGDEITTKSTSFPGLRSDPLNAPAFECKIQGKRTYSIKLVALPQTWYQKLRADEADREPERVQTINVGPVTVHDPASMNGTSTADQEHDDDFDAIMRNIDLDAPTVYDVTPPLEIAMASQVAMSLLTTVVEIISAGTGAAVDEKVRTLQGDLNDALGKLSARLEDNDRMRRQLRQAGDEIVALRHERDGLRSRLRATEANLTAALKGDAVAAINGEIQRRVDQIMRVAPKGKGDA